MSPAITVSCAYALVALVTAGLAASRRAPVGDVVGWPAWILIGALWPFLLPGVWSPPPRASGYAERLGAIQRSIEGALDDPRSARLLPRRGELMAAVQRLDRASVRLGELDLAIAGALPAARSRLETLRQRSEHALAERTALLEEVVAQLTVLRFVDAGDEPGGDRARVEAMLAQLEALIALEAGQ